MPRVSAVLLALVVTTLKPGPAGAGPSGTMGTADQTASTRSTRPMGADPRLLLPADGAIPGWMRTEEPGVFNGKTLFAHIDGGAEEFLAHGFRALGVGGYRKDSLEIVAEIYDMGTRRGAKEILDARGGAPPRDGAPSDGIVSNPVNTDPTARISPAVGDACVLDTTQVIFRRSRFYIAVTGFEAKPQVTAALRVLADSIDARIRAAGGSPAGK